MGTAMRFFVVLAGLGFMLFALAMIGPSLYDVFSSPDLSSDPWGYAAVLLMLAAVAAAPCYVGVRLVRKGLGAEATLPRDLDAAQDGRPLPPSVRAARAAHTAPPAVTPLPVPASTLASAAPDPPAGMAPAAVHRPRLAAAGLLMAFVGAIVLFLLWIFATVQPAANETERLGVRLLMLFASVPLLVGLWLARRFLAARQMAALLPLLRTSYGLAIATYVIAAPLMVLWHAQSAELGITALAVYSLVDPILNISRPSWLTSAVVSFGVGMVLFLALMVTAGMLRYLGNDQYNFMYPLILYVPAMGLSALARLVAHLRRPE
jgi:hypothetical protein